MKALLWTILLVMSGLPTRVFAQTNPPQTRDQERISELERRIEELEKISADFFTESNEGRGRVRAFFSDKVFFGGFFENGVTSVWGEDTPSQISANSHIFGINIAAEINEQIKFVGQVLNAIGYNFDNQHNDPRLTPSQRQFGGVVFGTLVAHSYLEYTFNPALIMQAGIGYAPFGYAFQQREPILFKRRGGPQMLGTAGVRNTGVAFPLWTGVHLRGSGPIWSGREGYNIYSFSPATNPKTLGWGARVWWSPTDDLTVGLSGQTAKENDDNFSSHGLDVRYENGRHGLTSEYAQSRVSGLDLVTESYYLEPSMSFNDGVFVAYLAADYVDNPNFTVQNGLSVISSPYQIWAWGAGVNWLPSTHVRMRLGFLNFQYVGETSSINGQNRDYNNVDLSAGITF